MVGSGFIKTGAVLSWEGVQYCGTPGFKVCASTFPRGKRRKPAFLWLSFLRARAPDVVQRQLNSLVRACAGVPNGV